ncbi:ABC transporter ATP-binding protein [Paenibacillus albidus]|uniref:ATP-binding cassette domain-containing protein n=1 Tax=Paenibacillus albidus TaxID=2041023 RepID=UPI001BE67F20|nr:ABC transporter ATP-binding protein [Paenibacillus albidus]MBT2288490.1 ABC transporter ATP-binding protein [Paenibacillus albidus]
MELLKAIDLSKTYGPERGWFATNNNKVNAVNNLALSLEQGENLGLVGESGCGKSTLARLLMGLEKPSSGKVLYRNMDFTDWSQRRMRMIRSKMQMVFQNSLSSFNPLFTVEQIIGEPLRNYRAGNAETRRAKVVETLELVGLNGRYLRRYPHELSGGQQQRIGIARAVALRPELIICDEPFSSLDVTLRKQMMDLLRELKLELGLSYIFITHDLSVVNRFCDSVAVMYQGEIVEKQTGANIMKQADHPYTRKLLASVPVQDPLLRGKRA